MSQKQTLLNAIDHLLAETQKRGAQADIIAQANDNFSLKANKGQLDEYKVSTSQVIGIRVVKDDRVATSYSESLATESLDMMLNNALESAKYAKIDPHQKSAWSAVKSSATTRSLIKSVMPQSMTKSL